MPYFCCELSGGINRLSFSTADDPFCKIAVPKYYPECVVINKEGLILATVNPYLKKQTDFGLNYNDDMRDPVLKINDDRKVKIQMGAIKDVGTMILLTVREYDLSNKQPHKEGDLERAWFRLSNDETNQTIDYSSIKKIELPEDYQESIPDEDDEKEPLRNELTYLHGILYLEEVQGVKKWVFESYKQVFQAKDF
jgi:hypothetical protein